MEIIIILKKQCLLLIKCLIHYGLLANLQLSCTEQDLLLAVHLY